MWMIHEMCADTPPLAAQAPHHATTLTERRRTLRVRPSRAWLYSAPVAASPDRGSAARAVGTGKIRRIRVTKSRGTLHNNFNLPTGGATRANVVVNDSGLINDTRRRIKLLLVEV